MCFIRPENIFTQRNLFSKLDIFSIILIEVTFLASNILMSENFFNESTYSKQKFNSQLVSNSFQRDARILCSFTTE